MLKRNIVVIILKVGVRGPVMDCGAILENQHELGEYCRVAPGNNASPGPLQSCRQAVAESVDASSPPIQIKVEALLLLPVIAIPFFWKRNFYA